MRKKLLVITISLLITVSGLSVFAMDARAEGRCGPVGMGCTCCYYQQSGDWDNCTYACGGASCPDCDTQNGECDETQCVSPE